jgi:hypothetical protein
MVISESQPFNVRKNEDPMSHRFNSLARRTSDRDFCHTTVVVHSHSNLAARLHPRQWHWYFWISALQREKNEDSMSALCNSLAWETSGPVPCDMSVLIHPHSNLAARLHLLRRHGISKFSALECGKTDEPVWHTHNRLARALCDAIGCQMDVPLH